MALFNKILIANRGEIAVRIIQTVREMGIRSAAIYSAADKDAYHPEIADESYFLEGEDLQSTYLNIENIVRLAVENHCDAVHPGYGFLAENSFFVEAVEKAGLIFIGPSAHAMKVMGNKLEARALARELNLPLLEGTTGNVKTILEESAAMEYPLLVKAAAGGGGKGMRVVRTANELKEALESTAREAKSYFGDGTVYVEKYIAKPRHIEIQVLGDKHGNVIHLFERECTIQRRHQKIIEETPSPSISAETRVRMGEEAVKISKRINYFSAGTVEFLVDEKGSFYFLEMNTRIQVEHPVTEMTTGIDIVRQQILIATGETLTLRQEDVSQKGHAIECRIYAEDPGANFMPAPGKMTAFYEPRGLWIRNDTSFVKATEIKSSFDPMISKLIVWAEDRELARQKMIHALGNYIIHGIKTNIIFLRTVMEDEHYINNRISTHYCDEQLEILNNRITENKQKIPFHLPLIAAAFHDMGKVSGFRESREENKLSVWQQVGHWSNGF